MGIDQSLFLLRAVLDFGIAASLGWLTIQLLPLWRTGELEPFPRALLLICAAIAPYMFVAGLINLGVGADPITPALVLRHVLTLPLLVLCVASFAACYFIVRK